MSTNAKTILAAPEQLDIENREDFQAAAVEVVEALKDTGGTLVLDLPDTEFIDTAGLGTMANIHRMAVEADLKVALLNANAEVIGSLELARLDELFELNHADA